MSERATNVHIGVLIPSREAVITGLPAPRLLDFACRAEQLGFDSVWTGDSLTARPRVEPLALLAAVAARTTRITLGTAALTATLRNPVLAAHSIATVDQLSAGRLVLALGAGFPMPATEAEFGLAGAAFRGRGTRMVETVELWRSLWRRADDDRPASADHLATATGIEALPRPARPGGPPLWLAGSGPRALERAGRHFDGWLPYPPTPSSYRAGLAVVRRAATTAGRDPGDVTPGLYLTVVIDEEPRRAHRRLDEYSRAYYGLSAEDLMAMQAVILGPPELCAHALDQYLAAGAAHLIVRIGALDPLHHLDQLAAAVLPVSAERGMSSHLRAPIETRIGPATAEETRCHG